MSKDVRDRDKVMKLYKIYMLELSDSSIYTGIATDVGRRIKDHERGHGSTYAYNRQPFNLIWISKLSYCYKDAAKMERYIKKMTHRSKWILAKGRIL